MTKENYWRRRQARSRARRSKVVQEILLYLAIAIFAFCGLFSVSGIKAKSQDQTVEKDYFKVVKVKEGDSLWKIAERYAPQNSDYRLYVSQLIEINELSSANIYAGQKILIPAEDAPPDVLPKKVRKNLACLRLTSGN